MKKDAEEAIFREWQATLITTYPEYKSCGGDTRACLIIPVKGIDVRVIISVLGDSLYCEVDRNNVPDANLPDDVIEKVGYLLPYRYRDDITRISEWFPHYSYDPAYKCFMEVIEILRKP